MLAYKFELFANADLQLLSNFIAQNKRHLTGRLLRSNTGLDAPVHLSAGPVISADCPGTRDSFHKHIDTVGGRRASMELVTVVFPTKGGKT